MNNGRVIVYIHPFILEQEICTYVGDECVQVIETPIDQVCEKICMLCKKYNINEVYFHGSQLYALKWKDDFAAHKFTEQDINIYIN